MSNLFSSFSQSLSLFILRIFLSNFLPFFFVLYDAIHLEKYTTDPEYKLKSANQTPTALNNALTNSHEITRNIMDERKAYIKGVRKI
jgi:hypothetical protein